jgi:hypothetical protein
LLPFGHVLITEIDNSCRSDHSRVRRDDLTHHIAELTEGVTTMPRELDSVNQNFRLVVPRHTPEPSAEEQERKKEY